MVKDIILAEEGALEGVRPVKGKLGMEKLGLAREDLNDEATDDRDDGLVDRIELSTKIGVLDAEDLTPDEITESAENVGIEESTLCTEDNDTKDRLDCERLTTVIEGREE